VPLESATRSASEPGTGSDIVPRSARRMRLARATISSSTCSSAAPESSALVTSALASIQRWRTRDSSYSRAFSIATPAATASVVSTASSSPSNSLALRFSVR
jgi:hypothetical protein